jgi:hypothetical protein
MAVRKIDADGAVHIGTFAQIGVFKNGRVHTPSPDTRHVDPGATLRTIRRDGIKIDT